MTVWIPDTTHDHVENISQYFPPLHNSQHELVKLTPGMSFTSGHVIRNLKEWLYWKTLTTDCHLNVTSFVQ